MNIKKENKKRDRKICLRLCPLLTKTKKRVFIIKGYLK